MPTSTDLVTDLPADFDVFGQSVDTSMADLKGGTTGQILSKASATDMDFTWITNDVGDITAVTAGTGISGGGTSGAVTVTNSMATAITTAGDVIQGTGSGTFSRLGIGTAGQVLTVNSGATALEYTTPASGGETLLSTTALSTGSVTISIASGYKNVYLVVRDMAPAASGYLMQMRLNSDTASNYFSSNYFGVGTSTGSQVETNTAIQLTPAAQSSNTNADSVFVINIYDYLNTASKRIVTVQGNYVAAGGSSQVATNTVASYLNVGTAISSITFFISGSTFGAGSALLYGVK